MDKIWDSVKSFSKALQNSGEWEKQRRKQTGKWMWSLVEEGLLTNFRNHPDLQKQIPELEKEVESGKMLPTTAARKLLDSWYVG
jgi:LAO/AO transport system kinase